MTDPDPELLAWAPNPAEQSTGMSLPGYSDFRLVAEGGEGTVYRARQDGLDRYVAVKVINLGDPARLARFRRELEITVRLGRQHPHIVTVIDTGTAPNGLPCIVMEYYDLGSLHDRLRERGPLPVSEVVAAGIAVADALSFAHAQGFLHRDVKPQNILILPTSYVLADFGIARMADAGHTTSLQLVSYRHAAPQMIDGQAPAAADDLWSLGSTLFTLLDGAPPFASDNPDEDTMLSYVDRVRSAEPRPIRRADVPPELAAVITSCLAKRREDRYPDAAALRSALSAVDVGTAGWAAAPPVADFGPRPQPFVEATPPPAPDSERTTAGPGSGLAGLTVRLAPEQQTSFVDFGPRTPEYPAVPWGQQPEPTAPVAAPRPRRNLRRVLAFALAALVVGAGTGIAFTVLNKQSSRAGPPPQTSTAPPSTGTSAPQNTGDPSVSPTLAPLDDRGTTVTLSWTDPTRGRAQFIVVDVTEPTPVALVTVAAGTTTYTVDNLDPARQYCFQIAAISIDDPTGKRGASPRTCTAR